MAIPRSLRRLERSCPWTPSTLNETAGALLADVRAVRPDELPVGEFPQEVLGEVVLVVADGLHAKVVEVVDGGAERDPLGDGRGACLELPREFVPRGVGEGDVADHLPAEQERVEVLQNLALPVQAADPGGAGEFVAAEREEVRVHRPDVDGARRGGLSAVDDRVRVVVVREVDEVRDGVDRAEHVRHVRCTHDRSVVGDDLGGRVHVEVAVGRDGDVPDRRARPLCDLLPRHERRVVVHLRRDNLVVSVQVLADPVRDEVDALGRVLREHHLLAAVGADELGDAVVRLLVGDRGLVAEFVDAAVDVRVVVGVELLEDVVHLFGRMRGGGVVEVRERVAVHPAFENGEVVANRRGVEGHISVHTAPPYK